MGNRFEIIGHDVIVNLMNALTMFEARVDTAGSLHGGQRVFMSALLPGKEEIVDDEIEQYALITTAHNGLGEFKVLVTPVRSVCKNTVSFAIDEAKASIALRHTKNYPDKPEQAECMFHAGRWKPNHVSQADYDRLLSEFGQEVVTAYARLLDETGIPSQWLKNRLSA